MKWKSRGIVLVAVLLFTTPPLASAISFPDKSRLQISEAQNIIRLWNYDPGTFIRTEIFCTGVML